VAVSRDKESDMGRKGLWLAAAIAAAGCAGDGDGAAPTYEEWKATTFVEPWDGGAFIIDGDTPIISDKALYEKWLALFGGQALIVHQAGGGDARWNDTEKRHLTYCVSDAFGTRKPAVLAALRQATELGWEARGDVDFIHVTAEDGACTADNPNVVFDVRPVNVGGQYLARAFFPDYPRQSRNVLIDGSAFARGLPWPLDNILAHELGHALGFRHEHTRPESGSCFEDNAWRPLTPYDAASVMHYPQCNGTSSDLGFTARDAEGIVALYGPPGREPPPPPPPSDDTQTWRGDLMAGTFKVVGGPIEVAPGSTLTVTMTGSGDPDLYLRFGEAPTRSLYACRPYVDGASERCALTVPSDARAFYVAVAGYRAAHYVVTASYSGSGGPPGAGRLVINEVLADPPAGFDANRDGTANTVADEFIELVNAGDAVLDLGGATLADGHGDRGTFPTGTTLSPGAALVVFGGGQPDLPGVTTLVFAPLQLNNGGDQLTITGADGQILAHVAFGVEGGRDQSLVRATDGAPAAAFVLHRTVSSTPASPGRRSDGSPL
jgi:serine protease